MGSISRLVVLKAVRKHIPCLARCDERWDCRCDNPNEGKEQERNEMWDGTHNIKHDDTAEAMTGAVKWDLVNALKAHGFSLSISHTLKTHEIITAHKLWSRMQTADRELGPRGLKKQGMPDDEWKTAARRRLRLWIRMCECGLLKEETGDHSLACHRG